MQRYREQKGFLDQKNGKYFCGLTDYYREPNQRKIPTVYVERFFQSCDMTDPVYIFNKYEEELEKKIYEWDKEIGEIDKKLNEIRQKYVIGNNSYLLLEIKIRDVENGSALWSAIFDIQERELEERIPWSDENERIRFDLGIEKKQS